MAQKISTKDFASAEEKMNNLLEIATQKGGFNFLSKKESENLNKNTKIVHQYETENFSIPMPETIQGLIEL